jgi:hypothetical protein
LTGKKPKMKSERPIIWRITADIITVIMIDNFIFIRIIWVVSWIQQQREATSSTDFVIWLLCLFEHPNKFSGVFVRLKLCFKNIFENFIKKKLFASSIFI